jgi:hypothetical protein
MENFGDKFDIVKGVDGRAKAQCRLCRRTMAKNVGMMRIHYKMSHGHGKVVNTAVEYEMQSDTNGLLEPPHVRSRSIAAAKTKLLNPKMAEIEKLIREDANEISMQQAVKRGRCASTVARGTIRRQKLQKLVENVSVPPKLQGQLIDLLKTAAAVGGDTTVEEPTVPTKVDEPPQQSVSYPIDITDLRMSTANKNAKRIGDLLAKNPEAIGRSADDELVIDGQVLPGTNYITTVKGLFYGQHPPKGVSKLVARLKDLGATSNMISNKTARILFEQSGNGLLPPGRRIQFMRIY